MISLNKEDKHDDKYVEYIMTHIYYGRYFICIHVYILMMSNRN